MNEFSFLFTAVMPALLLLLRVKRKVFSLSLITQVNNILVREILWAEMKHKNKNSNNNSYDQH